MAMSRKIKLSPLKLTLWTGSGTPTTKLVHIGLRTVQEEPSGSNSAVATGLCKDMASDADDGDVVVVESTVQEQQSHTSETYIVEPSHYEIETKAAEKHWANIRKQFVVAHTEESAMQESSVCIQCSKTAELCCKSCGPHVFYCSSCFQHTHSNVNIFHVAEKWHATMQLIYLWSLFMHFTCRTITMNFLKVTSKKGLLEDQLTVLQNQGRRHYVLMNMIS